MLSHPLTTFEIQKYYQNEPKFNGFYSRNNLPKIKDEIFLINVAEYKSIGTDLIVLYVNGNKGRASYQEIDFGGFGGWNIRKEIENVIGNKNIITNTYKIQACGR